MNIKKLIKSILPGIFLLGFTIGTGSVTAMAKAGADYGMSLLWALLLSCYITYFMINQFGLFTLRTGDTAMAAFKKNIHPAVSIFFIVALTLHVSGSIVGMTGLMADMTHEWSKSFIDGGLPTVAIALFFVILVYLLFLDGRTKVFQKALAYIVVIMAICFLISFFLLAPPIGEIARGLVPNVPDTGSVAQTFLVIASMVGTTVFSGVFLIRGTQIKEAEWTFADFKTQRRDAITSAVMMFIISASVMATASGTLHVQGFKMNNVTEMISILEPVAGLFAAGIFTIGVVAAGLSSQLPIASLTPWLTEDFRERKPNLKRPEYRIYALILLLLGMILPIFHVRPVIIMVASQAFSAVILPFTVACLIYLGNNE